MAETSSVSFVEISDNDILHLLRPNGRGKSVPEIRAELAVKKGAALSQIPTVAVQRTLEGLKPITRSSGEGDTRRWRVQFD